MMVRKSQSGQIGEDRETWGPAQWLTVLVDEEGSHDNDDDDDCRTIGAKAPDLFDYDRFGLKIGLPSAVYRFDYIEIFYC